MGQVMQNKGIINRTVIKIKGVKLSRILENAPLYHVIFCFVGFNFFSDVWAEKTGV